MAAQLPRDILWRIFQENTDMNSDMIWTWHGVYGHCTSRNESNALLHARYQSQVCHHWPNTILGFPSVWSRILNTRILGQSNDLWRTEVLRRTQKAPLHVLAVVGHADEWAVLFLKNNWHRVDEIELYLEEGLLQDEQKTIRDVLIESSQEIKRLVLHSVTIKIDFSISYGNDPPGTTPIFPGTMQNLGFLHLENVSITFNPIYVHAFAGIGTLFLVRVSFSPAHTTQDLLTSLGQMPLLHSFGLWCDADDEEDEEDCNLVFTENGSLSQINHNLSNLRNLASSPIYWLAHASWPA
ncbi:hypothetical protein CPB83DRAFT_900803 [Crepidotus variabilis]|uniref:Uncharacterized protein n=1 Tax=Crepidotus variabilis TaxID=179855 RepID=A0A9P6BC86_9AGAR|nr:hypothetical protein CPB83DRAFT_900803 [Crepidotus variabilis]